MIVAGFALIAGTGVAAGQTGEPSGSAYQIARDFAGCAAVFDALSAFAGPHDTNVSEHYKGLANGAEVAAAVSASIVVKPKAAWTFAENTRRAEAPYWKAIVLNEGLTEEVKARMEHCQKLNPLQTELVEEARRQAYGFNK